MTLDLETLQLKTLSLFRAYDSIVNLMTEEDPGQLFLLQRLNHEFELLCVEVLRLNASDVSETSFDSCRQLATRGWFDETLPDSPNRGEGTDRSDQAQPARSVPHGSHFLASR